MVGHFSFFSCFLRVDFILVRGVKCSYVYQVLIIVEPCFFMRAICCHAMHQGTNILFKLRVRMQYYEVQLQQCATLSHSYSFGMNSFVSVMHQGQ